VGCTVNCDFNGVKIAKNMLNSAILIFMSYKAYRSVSTARIVFVQCWIMTGEVCNRDSTSWSVKTVSGVHTASCWGGTGNPYHGSKAAGAWSWLLPPRTRISVAVTRLTHEVVQHQAKGWAFTVLFVPCTSASWCSTMHILIQSSCIRKCFGSGHHRHQGRQQHRPKSTATCLRNCTSYGPASCFS
jgi:hypothetical protein